MSSASYIALMRGQTPDGTWRQPGETFTTSAPEGDWMQPLDKNGNPVEKKPKPKAKAGPDAAAVEKLLDEAAKRADEAEKARDAALAELAALKAK